MARTFYIKIIGLYMKSFDSLLTFLENEIALKRKM